ncbi:MAG: hypothetical protein OFPII_03900 [Osedax symbiont Rs1]|nr:MAG: hypothetical protein OFPII_03900 [Osedax symbiont Rs1]
MKLLMAATPIMKLALPLMIIQLCQASLGLMDTLIAGRYFYKDLAAIGLGSNLWTPVGMLITGILYVLVPRISALTANSADESAAALADLRQQGERLALIIGTIALVLVLALSLLPAALIDDTATATIASHYLRYAAFGMPGLALFVMYRFLCEGHSHISAIMLAALILAVINPLLNVALVNGLVGLPKLGGAGCGLATALSSWLAAGLMRQTCKRKLPALFSTAPANHRDNSWKVLLGQGLAIGIALVLEVLALTALALLAARMGIRVIGAHQIAINIAMVIFMIPVALSSAATIRVAYYRGQLDAVGAQQTTLAAMLIAAGYGALMTVIILVVGEGVLSAFTNDQQVLAIASGLLLFIAAFQLLDALQITAAGVLRGMEEFIKPLIAVLITYWGLVIPLSYAIGVRGWLLPGYIGINTIWFMLSVGLSIAALILGYQAFSVLKEFSAANKSEPGNKRPAVNRAESLSLS